MKKQASASRLADGADHGNAGRNRSRQPVPGGAVNTIFRCLSMACHTICHPDPGDQKVRIDCRRRRLYLVIVRCTKTGLRR